MNTLKNKKKPVQPAILILNGSKIEGGHVYRLSIKIYCVGCVQILKKQLITILRWVNGVWAKKLKVHRFSSFFTRIIADFLENRSFIVNNFSSLSRNIEAGVPLGSVLSPTLFSLFINDIPVKNKKAYEHTLLFADDISYLFSIKNIFKDQESAQRYLDDLVEWMGNWRLCLAPHKCVFTIFSRNKGKK